MRINQLSRKAFTLLELIVVIVILGVLAALAIPTFASVISRSQDDTTLTGLKSLAREAQAINAFEDSSVWVEGSAVAAIGDLTAYAPGLQASGLKSAPIGGKNSLPVPSVDSPVTYSLYEPAGATSTVLMFARFSDSGKLCVVAALPAGTVEGGCDNALGEDKETIDPGDVFDDGVINLPGLPVSPNPTPTTPGGTPTTPAYNDNGVVTNVTVSNIKYNTASLAWTNVDKATEYHVTYGVVGGSMTTVTSSVNSYSLTGLTEGANYIITVQAVRPDSPAASAPTSFSTLVKNGDSWSTWSEAAPLPAAYSGVVQAVVVDRTIYAVSSQYLYAYDIDTNTWTTKASSGLAGIGAAFNINGKIYIFNYESKVKMYDPATNVWVNKSTNTKNTDHSGFTAGYVDGKVVMIGGGFNALKNKTDIYDVATDKWTAGPALPFNLVGATSFSKDGLIYVFGGTRTGGTNMDALLTVNAGGQASTNAAINGTTIKGGAGAVFYQGKAYFAGGFFGGYLPTVQTFDPVDGRYGTKTNIPYAVSGAGVAVVDNKLFVIGGTTHQPGGGGELYSPKVYVME